MTNVEKLQQLGILGDVRERLGAENENDESQDAKINKMTPHQIVKEWCAWKIGDGWWWSEMKSYFDSLSSENNKEVQP
jgi:hypothetical protein